MVAIPLLGGLAPRFQSAGHMHSAGAGSETAKKFFFGSIDLDR